MTDDSAVHADPVLALVPDGRADPRALYYLWEQQQWEAGKLDLMTDAHQWSELDPGTRRPVADSIAWRRARAEAAITALVPYVDLAPHEEQQVFLTTQLVDEARHVVFFDRVQREVALLAGEADDGAGIVDDPDLGHLMADVLPGLARELRADNADLAQLVTAITSYHVVILGVLGLTEQRALGSFLADEGVLPGIRHGLELEARAAARHVAFGLGFLAGAVQQEPSLRAPVVDAVDRSLPRVRSALGSLGSVAPTPYSGRDLIDCADSSLERWFEEVGLELPVPS